MPMVAEEANHGQIIVDDAHIDNAAKCDMTKQSKYFSKAMTKEMALEIEDLEIEENESCPPETDFDQLSRHEQQAKLASVSKGLSAFPAPIEHDGGSSLADFTKSLANITLSKAGVTEISRQLPSECHIDDEFDEIHTSSFQPSCSAPISGSGLYQPLGPATTEQQHHYNQQYGGWDNDLIRAIHVSIGPPQRSRPMRHTSLPAEFVCCVDGRQSADKYEFFRVSQTSNHSVGSDNELMSIHSEFDPNKVRLKADIGICQNEVVLSKGEIWKPRKL
jgi:hypothetical protein